MPDFSKIATDPTIRRVVQDTLVEWANRPSVFAQIFAGMTDENVFPPLPATPEECSLWRGHIDYWSVRKQLHVDRLAIETMVVGNVLETQGRGNVEVLQYAVRKSRVRQLRKLQAECWARETRRILEAQAGPVDLAYASNLDAIAHIRYGITRAPGETDAELRARCAQSMKGYWRT